jgi:hypothetical protein
MPASLPERVYEAMRDRIRGLSLSGIDSANIVSGQWYPRALADVDPAPQIVVSPIHAESFPGGMNSTDDIGIPAAIVIIDKLNQKVQENFSRNMTWRWSILSALRYQRLTGITEVYTVNPEPSEIFSQSMAKQFNLYVSTLVFRAMTRTVRG